MRTLEVVVANRCHSGGHAVSLCTWQPYSLSACCILSGSFAGLSCCLHGSVLADDVQRSCWSHKECFVTSLHLVRHASPLVLNHEFGACS